MKYNPNEIEAKWQNIGQKIKLAAVNNSEKPKHYVLDMFPSIRSRVARTSLRVYCSDVYARYKRHQGFNVAPNGL
jgi:leucyl-tRNA synthetase